MAHPIPIDIVSGFLGAGKTTLIQKLLEAAAARGEKAAVIENEFGEAAIDGAVLRQGGVTVTELSSGCICCSLEGDFTQALETVGRDYAPDRILIEPSGVARLSDILRASETIFRAGLAVPGMAAAVVNAKKYKLYLQNFGDFFRDQIACANLLVLSRTQEVDAARLGHAVADLRAINPEASLVTTPWEQLSADAIWAAAGEGVTRFAEALAAEEREHPVRCACGHVHAHGEACGHAHGSEHDHGHTHDHDGHGHDGVHVHARAADEAFESFSLETARTYTEAQIEAALRGLSDAEAGLVLRAKGFLPGPEGGWRRFDYVAGDVGIAPCPPAVSGRVCVIGSGLNEAHIAALFAAGGEA